ncbi:MAG: 50S ribosomal protein L18 [Proteobacteria bacterium]|nr:50S ribosomal protein L18 [Pseudomonadota bacterium]
MSKLFLNENFKRRKLKIREKLSGSSVRPRLTVFRSNKFIYGQLIDDTKGKTIVSISSKLISGDKNKVDASFEAGKELAKKAVEKGITSAVFDRNGYIYHGRIQKFAEGSRDGGLKF